ncbi:hypothetical protein ABM016_08535 [Morganella morganii]|uniref:hypothetical protein n=1 Tax=Morganella morganii TaxID=582 RepID=UPI003EC0EE09
MPSIQGAQTHQVPAHMNNDLRSTNGAVSQSSYVSSSGIKSVLLNAWNTVKSAVSGMLSSFGLHISGEQGSDKPGREIAMDIFPRPASPLPVDVQFENDIYESSGGNIYDSVYAHTVSGRLSLTGALYSEIEEPLYEEIGSNQAQTPPPVNLSTHPSLLRLSGSEIEEPLYEEIGSDQTQTPPPVNLSTHPSLSHLSGSGAASQVMVQVSDIYIAPCNSLDAGSNVKSEEPGYELLHENNYAVPYKLGNAVSIPDNDRKQSLPDVPLQQRIMRERLYTL